MNETKIRILEKTIKIIEEVVDNDDMYDFLLDWTSGRPMDTQANLESLIDGIKQYNQHKEA
jgi:hypothetical protein